MPALNAEREPLPPLYDGWMLELLEGVIPRESRATCNNCAMCSQPGAESGPRERYFDPTIKCCTYIPVLPNFLVGRILTDDDPAARPGRLAVEKGSRKALRSRHWGWARLQRISCFMTTLIETRSDVAEPSVAHIISKMVGAAASGATAIRCVRHGFASTGEVSWDTFFGESPCYPYCD